MAGDKSVGAHKCFPTRSCRASFRETVCRSGIGADARGVRGIGRASRCPFSYWDSLEFPGARLFENSANLFIFSWMLGHEVESRTTTVRCLPARFCWYRMF